MNKIIFCIDCKKVEVPKYIRCEDCQKVNSNCIECGKPSKMYRRCFICRKNIICKYSKSENKTI